VLVFGSGAGATYTRRVAIRSSNHAGLRRVLCVTLLAVLPSVVSCQTTRAGQGSGDPLVDPDEVPEQLRDEWQALVAAQEGDRSAEAVDAAADALLDQAPPPRLRAGALLAKAERQYLLGNDDEAIVLADEAAGLLASRDRPELKHHQQLTSAVHRILALALTRGGDPDRALAQLEQLDQWGGIERLELRGARAVALDRKGDTAQALAAFVAWRELLTDDAPEAGYAEERISALVAHLDRGTIEALAEAAPGPDAADCLRATLGRDPGPQAPGWVSGCRPLPARIGILLPRTGKLSALAEAQLAAAVAAVTVLGRERPVSVMWRDSGSSPDTAKAGADLLVADGAEVIIGPVGAANVRAALSTVGDDRFLLPGESAGSARGVAPTLEERTVSLIDFARASGVAEVLVLTPDSGYGRRVRRAEKSVDKSGFKSLNFIDYPTSTTSFAPILRPHLEALRRGAALVIADALPRTELIVRQLRREQFRVLGGNVDSEGTEVLVLGTGEGLAPDAIGPKHASLDGVVLAPVAYPDAASRAFEDEYFAQQQRRPDDQALLVWRALEAAWSGASSTLEPRPTLVRVQGSGVVALSAP
jgi:ABC-type branched-subunit amino acid transport system substrate-binding protein